MVKSLSIYKIYIQEPCICNREIIASRSWLIFASWCLWSLFFPFSVSNWKLNHTLSVEKIFMSFLCHWLFTMNPKMTFIFSFHFFLNHLIKVWISAKQCKAKLFLFCYWVTACYCISCLFLVEWMEAEDGDCCWQYQKQLGLSYECILSCGC